MKIEINLNTNILTADCSLSDLIAALREGNLPVTLAATPEQAEPVAQEPAPEQEQSIPSLAPVVQFSDAPETSIEAVQEDQEEQTVEATPAPVQIDLGLPEEVTGPFKNAWEATCSNNRLKQYKEELEALMNPEERTPEEIWEANQSEAIRAKAAADAPRIAARREAERLARLEKAEREEEQARLTELVAQKETTPEPVQEEKSDRSIFGSKAPEPEITREIEVLVAPEPVQSEPEVKVLSFRERMALRNKQ